jgi:hypothetical protein
MTNREKILEVAKNRQQTTVRKKMSRSLFPSIRTNQLAGMSANVTTYSLLRVFGPLASISIRTEMTNRSQNTVPMIITPISFNCT